MSSARQSVGAPLEQLRRLLYDGLNAARVPGEVAFSLRRAGGVFGDHEAFLASERKAISPGYRALDRAVFADGAIKAAEWVMTPAPGLYDMEDVLGPKGVSF